MTTACLNVNHCIPSARDAFRLPGDNVWCAAGRGAGQTVEPGHGDASFRKDRSDGVVPLPQRDWADWDHAGRLLMASSQGTQGTLEVYTFGGTQRLRVWAADLRDRIPDPQPAPAWASRWYVNF